ncbi:hypothetical protein GCM10009733_059360 [Nonomuraea maheshkhaliensis]|uniref:Uncharacterized protein n=1 Tax=Nonomuraea maheshkhaliensis TaxID=419590 RepID=A0ABP4RL85_9ACTN
MDGRRQGTQRGVMTMTISRGIPRMRGPEPPREAGILVWDVILHLFGSQFRLSRRPMTWTNDVAGFRDYLNTDIAQMLDDPRLRSAEVRDTGPDTAVALGDALTRGEAELVETSPRLAEILQSAIGGNRRIKDAVFAVVTCLRLEDERRFVAPLKLDLGTGFQKAGPTPSSARRWRHCSRSRARSPYSPKRETARRPCGQHCCTGPTCSSSIWRCPVWTGSAPSRRSIGRGRTKQSSC